MCITYLEIVLHTVLEFCLGYLVLLCVKLFKKLSRHHDLPSYFQLSFKYINFPNQFSHVCQFSSSNVRKCFPPSFPLPPKPSILIGTCLSLVVVGTFYFQFYWFCHSNISFIILLHWQCFSAFTSHYLVLFYSLTFLSSIFYYILFKITDSFLSCVQFVDKPIESRLYFCYIVFDFCYFFGFWILLICLHYASVLTCCTFFFIQTQLSIFITIVLSFLF